MKMHITINNTHLDCFSLEALSQLLDEIDLLSNAEVWLDSHHGPLICFLKSQENMFLMYLSHNGEPGFTSVGDASREGGFDVTLANGQVDTYPL